MTQLDYLKALIANDALIQEANDNMFKRYGLSTSFSQRIPQDRPTKIDSFQYRIGVMQSLRRIALNPDEVYNLLYTLGQIEDYASHATEFQKHMLNRRNVPTDKFMSEWERYRETVILHGILPIQNVPQQYIDAYNKKLEDRKDLAKELSNRRKDHTELLSELEDIHKQIQFEMDAYNKDLKMDHKQQIELLNEQEYLLRQDIDNAQALMEWDYYLLKQQEQAEKDDILRNEQMNKLIPNLGNIKNISTTNLPQSLPNYDSTYNKFINAINQSRLEDTEKELMANEDTNNKDETKQYNNKWLQKKYFNRQLKNVDNLIQKDLNKEKQRNKSEAEERIIMTLEDNWAKDDRDIFKPENVIDVSSDPWATLESQWADMKQRETEKLDKKIKKLNNELDKETKKLLKSEQNARTYNINTPHYDNAIYQLDRDIRKTETDIKHIEKVLNMLPPTSNYAYDRISLVAHLIEKLNANITLYNSIISKVPVRNLRPKELYEEKFYDPKD